MFSDVLKGFQTPSKILTLLFSKVIYKETLDGENLIQYGDEVDYFYLIKKGENRFNIRTIVIVKRRNNW